MIEDRPQSALFADLAEHLIARGCGFRFQAKGRSMLPAIADGDILQVIPIRDTKIRTGDIVLFRDGAEFKAHRVVAARGQRFTTRGDSAADADAEICSDQILGIVSSKESGKTGVAHLRGSRARCIFLAREAQKRMSALWAHLGGAARSITFTR